MKKYLLIFVLTLSANYIYADTSLIITGHPDYPPFNWKKGDILTGFAVEAAEMIFRELGITVESKYVGPWNRCLHYIEEGKADVLAAAFITEDRKRYADFLTTPLVEDRKSIFVLKGREFEFEKWEDLAGKKAGVQLGVSYGQEFDDFLKKHTKIDYVRNQVLNFRKLDNGRIDFITSGSFIGRSDAKRAGCGDRVVELKNPVMVGYSHIAVSKKSKYVKYVPGADKILARLRSEGVIDMLIEKYIRLYSENINSDFDFEDE